MNAVKLAPASAVKRAACSYERSQACGVECRRMNLKEASAYLVFGNRRPVRTTNTSQIGRPCVNVHRCIIDEASGEITAK